MRVPLGKLKVFIFVCLIVILIGIAFSSLALDRTLKYLPRNEDISFSRKTLDNLVLNGITCTAQDSSLAADRCYQCLEAKKNCPDCCVKNNGRAIACTSGHDHKYSAKNKIFSCPRAMDGCTDGTCLNENERFCQQRACPDNSIGPFSKFSANNFNCIFSNGAWLCNQNNLVGCAFATPSPFPNSDKCGYDIETITEEQCCNDGSTCPSGTVCPCKDNLGLTTGTCWKYTAKPGMDDCTASCKVATKEYDEYINNLNCCKNNDTCPGGFDKDCKRADCVSRINIPGCDGFTPEQCATLTEDAVTCLNTARCSSCFKELDSSFRVKFVPKSRESVTILWQLNSTPQIPSTIPASAILFFYTRVKVFQGSQIVHESIVHQKDMKSAFSSFCLTHLDRDLLQSGKVYEIRLYYYFPQLANLSVKADNISLTLFRVRE